MRRFGAKPSRRRCPELVEGFSQTVNIHCTNLRDIALAAVVRWFEALRARVGESARQGEGLFQSLLAQSFSEGLSQSFG